MCARVTGAPAMGARAPKAHESNVPRPNLSFASLLSCDAAPNSMMGDGQENAAAGLIGESCGLLAGEALAACGPSGQPDRQVRAADARPLPARWRERASPGEIREL